ncbi:MAG: adenosylmethionine--8-amino-7-oxononanoate transaminase [Gammaproteobacteria bacterium]|nr:adenosylmethionine--8-amino-7-oxononanoate transaminase [Gammaproteobacteria bacterium]
MTPYSKQSAAAESGLQQRDLRHLWHPCTQMQDHEWLPLVEVASAKGVWLHDYQGRRYLDAVSSWWVNLFGHSNDHINARIRLQLEQVEHVMMAGCTHAPAVELAEQLVAITPPALERVFYADNGSAAVEVALKMSFHYWLHQGQQRSRFVALSNSYHGETLGALAVGDVGLYRDLYAPLLLQPLIAPAADDFLRPPGMSSEDFVRERFAAMEALLREHAGEVAAVIVEPLVQCAGGMRMYDPLYLRLLRELCDELNVHLIADEIATGFGRTGSMFACEQAAITPDFMCLSKGLTGGYLPLSAVLTTQQVYRAFYADYAALKAFLHSHSYTGNPLACAAALATLELFRERDVLADNRILAQQILAGVEALREHPQVGDVRQRGMITAVEMVADKARRQPYPWQQRRGMRVYQYGLEHEMFLRPLGNVVYMMPPYVINADEIRRMTAVVCDGVNLACRD